MRGDVSDTVSSVTLCHDKRNSIRRCTESPPLLVCARAERPWAATTTPADDAASGLTDS
jgi:hypothetical protein